MNVLKKILIVEDDQLLKRTLAYNLTSDGYEVISVFNFDSAVRKLRENEFDVALLDINLPDGSGLDLCEEIRNRGQHTYIIFITANDKESDMLKGYEVGGADYVTKPFNPLELVARVKSQLRRYTQLGNVSESNETVYQVGGLMINDDLKEVTVDGELVKLTPIEYNILLLLVKNQGKVFSIKQIYENIWNEDAIGADNTVAVHIRHIREKIEINPKEPRYLKVVWGVGYKVEKN